MKDGTVGLDLIAERDRGDVARLSGDPAMFDRLVGERAEAAGYGFVIRDRADPIGLCVLRGIAMGTARELGCLIRPESRREGYARFGLGLTLGFAFVNLRLDRVHRLPAQAGSEEAWSKLLGAVGFDAEGVLTRPAWLAARDGPNLGRLHPGLRAILDAELAAGNEVKETGTGWPDPDSVFVQLREPFKTRPDPLPSGIEFVALNDPHWWMAEYHSVKPRHLLVH